MQTIALLSIAVLAFPLTGHTSIHPRRIVLAPLLAVHLLVVAFWFGSLLPLWSVSKRESLDVAVRILQRFSTCATWLVPLIAIAGLAMAFLLVSGVPNVREPYGLLLATKFSGFSILMVVAALNKWRLVPAIEAGLTGSRGALRRSMMLEFLLIIGVLAATAVMTALFSP